MQRVTGEYRDSLIAGFRGEALHLELRDVYAAADHGRLRRWLAGEQFDPNGIEKVLTAGSDGSDGRDLLRRADATSWMISVATAARRE